MDTSILYMLQNLPAEVIEPDEAAPEVEGVRYVDVEVPEGLRKLWALIKQIQRQGLEIIGEAQTSEELGPCGMQKLNELKRVSELIKPIFWHDLRQLLDPSLRPMPIIGIAPGWRVWVHETTGGCDGPNCPMCSIRRAIEA